MKRLNLGSGTQPALGEGWENVDCVALEGVDRVLDLDCYPWPWADDSVQEVRARESLEHLTSKMAPIAEMWRILRHGGRVEIMTPNALTNDCLLLHPGHMMFYHPGQFAYYAPDAGRSWQAGHRPGRDGWRPGCVSFITADVDHDSLHLKWILYAYKRHDPALLAEHKPWQAWWAKLNYWGRRWPQDPAVIAAAVRQYEERRADYYARIAELQREHFSALVGVG